MICLTVRLYFSVALLTGAWMEIGLRGRGASRSWSLPSYRMQFVVDFNILGNYCLGMKTSRPGQSGGHKEIP
jgi:hypothetical protein